MIWFVLFWYKRRNKTAFITLGYQSRVRWLIENDGWYSINLKEDKEGEEKKEEEEGREKGTEEVKGRRNMNKIKTLRVIYTLKSMHLFHNKIRSRCRVEYLLYAF